MEDKNLPPEEEVNLEVDKFEDKSIRNKGIILGKFLSDLSSGLENIIQGSSGITFMVANVITAWMHADFVEEILNSGSVEKMEYFMKVFCLLLIACLLAIVTPKFVRNVAQAKREKREILTNVVVNSKEGMKLIQPSIDRINGFITNNTISALICIITIVAIHTLLATVLFFGLISSDMKGGTMQANLYLGVAAAVASALVDLIVGLMSNTEIDTKQFEVDTTKVNKYAESVVNAVKNNKELNKMLIQMDVIRSLTDKDNATHMIRKQQRVLAESQSQETGENLLEKEEEDKPDPSQVEIKFDDIKVQRLRKSIIEYTDSVDICNDIFKADGDVSKEEIQKFFRGRDVTNDATLSNLSSMLSTMISTSKAYYTHRNSNLKGNAFKGKVKNLETSYRDLYISVKGFIKSNS